MKSPQPNDLPRELLAAYVDGELDTASRIAVERWLADNPAAFTELQTQRAFSPANGELWARAEPPEPSEAEWKLARSRIEKSLQVEGPSRWRAAAWAITGLLTTGVAAAVAWFSLAPVAPPATNGGQRPNAPQFVMALAPAPREIVLVHAAHSIDPLNGITVLDLATDEDVVLDRVPEFPTGWIVAGRHPIEGILALATEEELRIAEFGPGSAWPPGGPKMTTAPGDAPMIFVKPLR